MDQWATNISESGKVERITSVSWWMVGDEAVAMSEGPIGRFVVRYNFE